MGYLLGLFALLVLADFSLVLKVVTHSLLMFAFNFSSLNGVNSSRFRNSSTSSSISLFTFFDVYAISTGPGSGGELEEAYVERASSSSCFFLFLRRFREFFVGRSPSMKFTNSSTDIRSTELAAISLAVRKGAYGSRRLA